MEQQFNSEEIDIYSDLDEVYMQQSWRDYNLVMAGITQNPLNSLAYIYSLLQLSNRYAKDSNGIKEALYDRAGNAIEGETFHLLHHGMLDPNLAPYIPNMLQTLENSRCLISDTRTIYKHLKKKGSSINFATNKDHIAYLLSAQRFGKKLTDLPDKVFVAQPGNTELFLQDIKDFAEQSETPANYQQLVYEALTIQPSGNIIHAPSRKPEADYYQALIENSKRKNKKVAVFIDDKESNVNGFLALQNTTNITLYGIHFKNPQQLAQELINLKILSPDESQKLLKKINF